MISNFVLRSVMHPFDLSKTHILHYTNSLLSLRHKFILRLLNLLLRLGADLLLLCTIPGAGLRRRDRRHRQLPHVALGLGLGGIQSQTTLLDTLPRAGGEHDVGVERGVPPGQEAALDLGILRQASLADALLSQGELLERRGERVFASACVLLVQRLAASQGGAGDGVGEGLGLGLRGGGRGQGGLGLGRGGRGGEELDLLADGAAEVGEGLVDIAGVIVSFGSILVADKGGFVMSIGGLQPAKGFESPRKMMLTLQPASSGEQPSEHRRASPDQCSLGAAGSMMAAVVSICWAL